MIVGDPTVFAIEAGIATTDAPPSILGIGYFVLHVGGNATA